MKVVKYEDEVRCGFFVNYADYVLDDPHALFVVFQFLYWGRVVLFSVLTVACVYTGFFSEFTFSNSFKILSFLFGFFSYRMIKLLVNFYRAWRAGLDPVCGLTLREWVGFYGFGFLSKWLK